MPPPPRDLPHIYLQGTGNAERYTYPFEGGGRPRVPARDRDAHARRLQQELQAVVEAARRDLEAHDPERGTGTPGFYLEFSVTEADPDVLTRLENRTKEIELVAVRAPEEPGTTATATVFVPERSSEFFTRRVEAYRTQETRAGAPKNQALVARLEGARRATIRSVFTDRAARLPQPGVAVWWEVWLRAGTREHFNAAAQWLEIRTKDHVLVFPEREVILALAAIETLEQVLAHSDAIAELRLAKDQPSVFLDLAVREQVEWAGDLVARLNPPGPDAPAICLLDSGLNPAHPLIRPCVNPEDVHTCNPAWGADDRGQWDGHGTGMAGLALYGDLVDVLGGNRPVDVRHRLESVKILPPAGANEPESYGWLTQEAVARAEVQAPERARVICLAVTSDAEDTLGLPTAWSAAVDQLAYGDGEVQRLVVSSAGNLRDDLVAAEYLASNDVHGVESPAQAWNALTVGAYTEKVNIVEPDQEHVATLAPAGDLSPRSRTSVGWDRQWPIKPDLVLEGGNLGVDGDQVDRLADLKLLTTRHDFLYRGMYRGFADTSAATALAGRMAAQLMADRPDLWPETVRALLVHSAEWTPAMRRWLGPAPLQWQKENLLRRYGYGVPSLERAQRSARNDLTLVVQDSLQPYELRNAAVATREMKVHSFPWPTELLEGLGDAEVEMRVTLSYFIEPNPTERGWLRRYRYPSHGLRFEVKRSLETYDAFRRRINAAAREGGERPDGRAQPGDRWYFRRDLGSVHSDFWRASGAELAQRNAIAVYPIGGWWKEAPRLERYDRRVRYALVVSVRAPEIEVDIYTPIAAQVGVPVAIEA